MDITSLIGLRVQNTKTKQIGIIDKIENGLVYIDYHGKKVKNSFPAAFAEFLELEDENLQTLVESLGVGDGFDDFKKTYYKAVFDEMKYVKLESKKIYKAIDGVKLNVRTRNNFVYVFETDAEYNFPDATLIKIQREDEYIEAYTVGCEDFTITIRTNEYLGENVPSIDFTADQSRLLQSIMDRLDELNPTSDSLAFEIACTGKTKINEWNLLAYGQENAKKKALSDNITFIWGPPGTGKTETLAEIAMNYLSRGDRVLMLSFSNVSVDGAMLRVSDKAKGMEGKIIRYGHPRLKELIESDTLTSYQYILNQHPILAKEYQELMDEKKKLNKQDARKLTIKRRLNAIHESLKEYETELIQEAVFVATTITMATADYAIYKQKFDVVIFDEASMAYVPQVVFAAGLAQKAFVCLGDFCQLPAIVQNYEDVFLSKDIFEYTGILEAVDKNVGHDWLVMLNTQYRMHKDIADFVSREMYGGRLETAESVIDDKKEIAKCGPCENEAMALVDLSSLYSVCIKTMDGSRVNVLSAMICIGLAQKNIDNGSIGIITPYNAQSRLITSFIRDLREKDIRWEKVKCATVHQFQGSEEDIIIYDAVDCYRMTYPGALLTSIKGNVANRLFNVAMTRARGKFILLANTDYFFRKKLSKKLLFEKMMTKSLNFDNVIELDKIFNYIDLNDNKAKFYCGNRENTWGKFISDLSGAKTSINISIPGIIDDNEETIEELITVIDKKEEEKVDIKLEIDEDIVLPKDLMKYKTGKTYITMPITIIDKKIIWYGHPVSAADFKTNDEIINTEYFPCIRFSGPVAARTINALIS